MRGVALGALGLAAAAALAAYDPWGLDAYTDVKLVAWALLAAVSAAAWALGGADLPPPARLDAAALLALLTAGAAAAFSLDYTVSLAGPVHWRLDGLSALAALFGGYVLARALDISERPRPLFMGLAGAGLVLGAGAVLERLGWPPLPGLPAGLTDGRASSAAGSPVYLGAALAVALPAAVDLVLSETGRRRAFAAAAAALCLLGLWLCRSRGAWVAAAGGLAVWAAAAPAVLPERARRAALGVAAAALFLLPGLSLRRATRARSDEGRVELWRASLRLVRERPWTGWGPGTLELALGRRADAAFARAYGRRLTQASAHNDFLHAAAVAGLPGLAALLALWAAVFVAARAAVARGLPAAAGAAGGLAALFIQAKVSPVPFGVAVAGALYAAALVPAGAPRRSARLLGTAGVVGMLCLAGLSLRGVAADRAHLRALSAERAGRLPEAERALKEAARLDPSTTVPPFLRALLLLKVARGAPPEHRGRFLEAAAAASRSLVESRPQAAAGWHALGLALAERGGPGDSAEAARSLDEALLRDWRREGLFEAREALGPGSALAAAARERLAGGPR